MAYLSYLLSELDRSLLQLWLVQNCIPPEKRAGQMCRISHPAQQTRTKSYQRLGPRLNLKPKLGHFLSWLQFAVVLPTAKSTFDETYHLSSGGLKRW